jgi:hypothetical protein
MAFSLIDPHRPVGICLFHRDERLGRSMRKTARLQSVRKLVKEIPFCRAEWHDELGEKYHELAQHARHNRNILTPPEPRPTLGTRVTFFTLL